MTTSDKIATTALGLALVSVLVTATSFLTSGVVAVQDLSDRVGEPNPPTGIYAQINDQVSRLRQEFATTIGTPADQSGIYGEIYRANSIPLGTILPWIYSDVQPDVPEGWTLCDGTNGTPNLAGLFLLGATSRDNSKQTGGNANIPSGGGHNHGARTGRVHSNRILYLRGGDNNGVWFDHAHEIRAGGGHDHGGNNLPPYYTVMYIMKVS